MKKLTLPFAILVACTILGGFIYASQVSKQNSIERQQQVELESKKESEKNKFVFDSQLRCQGLTVDLKKKFNNILTVYYDETANTCMIDYLDESNTKQTARADAFGEKAKVTEKWIGETFTDGMLSDYSNEFNSKQACLAWGNSQKSMNSGNTYACATGCGEVAGYFICDPGSETEI